MVTNNTSKRKRIVIQTTPATSKESNMAADVDAIPTPAHNAIVTNNTSKRKRIVIQTTPATSKK